MSFIHASGQFSSSIFGSRVVGTVATLGAVAAGAAIVEVALVPGLLIGAAAVLAPRLLPRDMLGRVFGDRPSRTVPSAVPLVPGVRSAEVPASGEPASFDAWRAALKTFTYRLIVTTIDFGANYIVIGEFATAAGMSGMSLVAGPIFYFAHEAAWHYYGPASARQANAREALLCLRVSGGAGGGRNGQTRFASVKVRRAWPRRSPMRS
jgi:uncharacterized membrane protein